MFMIFRKTTWRTTTCGDALYYSYHRRVLDGGGSVREQAHPASGLGATYRVEEGPEAVEGTVVAWEVFLYVECIPHFCDKHRSLETQGP